MKMKIFSILVIAILALSNITMLLGTYPKADGVDSGLNPEWPGLTDWYQFDTNDSNDWQQHEYIDVRNASYFVDEDYVYFRLECYDEPNFAEHPQARYKWFIDINEPHDMYGSGNTIYKAEYLLFAEDSQNDGEVDIYLIEDLENNGFPTGDGYITNPGNITDPLVANYSIEGKYIDLYINRLNIGNPQDIWFTWATDKEHNNVDSSNGEFSDAFFEESISKSDIKIIKTCSKDKVYANESFTYMLTITNLGPHDSPQVNVTDILPENVTFDGSNPSLTAVTNNILYWEFTNLAAEESIVITINVTAKNKPGIIINKADVVNGEYDPGINNHDEVETEILHNADVSITKTSSTDSVLPGDFLNYTLLITNDGPTESENIIVTDMLPENVTFITSTPPDTSNDSSTYTWELGDLPADDTKSINITVQVKNIRPTILSNTATVTSGSNDYNIDNNEAENNVNVGSVADISIEKSDSLDPVYYGITFNYTLIVKNNGPDDALNVTVTDTLPDQVSFVNADIPTTSSEGSNYSWEIGDLSVNESKYVNITVKVNTTHIGNITNNASVCSDTLDTCLVNNIVSENTFVNFSAELTVTKTCEIELGNNESNLSYAIAGGNLTYTINVTNLGPDTAKNITVTDFLPLNVSFVSSDPSPDYFSGQIYQWNISELEAYTSTFIILNVTINNGTIGILSNKVNVTSDTHDINDGNDNDTENITVKGVADISIKKTAEATYPVYPGDKITYILNVTNHGPDNALIVNITDILPPEVTFLDSITDVTIEKSGNNNSRYFWVIPSINCSDSVVIKINVTVKDGISGEITNYASVTEDSHDPMQENNSDEIKITVTKKPTGGGSGGGGGTGSDGTEPAITYSNPTAVINGPYFGVPKEEIQFDATESHDNDEDGRSIVRFDWKFSDDEDWRNDTGATPLYTYALSGTYNISLRVFDDEGSSDINTTFAVIVKANSPPGAPEITGPENGVRNESYNFSVVAIDEDGDDLKYTIDWGDGNITTSDLLASGVPFKTSHIWETSGNFTIQIIADDNSTITVEEVEIEIFEPEKVGETNVILPFLLLLLLLLIIFLFLWKRRRDKEGTEGESKAPAGTKQTH